MKNPFKYVIGDWSIVPPARRWAWMKMRIFGRFEIFRHYRRNWLKTTRYAEEQGKGETAFGALHKASVIQSLREDGISFGLDLPDDITLQILNFAQTAKFALNGQSQNMCKIENYNDMAARIGIVATHGIYPEPQKSCEAIDSLWKDSLITDVAREYLGCEPVSHDVKLMWSFPAAASKREQARLAQKFHYDLDDYRFIKFFFYLTDVEADGGPHVYVKKSHAAKPFWDQILIRRFSDEHVLRTFGAANVETILGRKGTGFVEDTFGIHKGVPPMSKARLLLQFEFARVDYGVKLL